MSQESREMPTSLPDEVGDVEASLYLDGLPEDAQEYACRVLGETPDTQLTMVLVCHRRDVRCRPRCRTRERKWGVRGNRMVCLKRLRSKPEECWGRHLTHN